MLSDIPANDLPTTETFDPQFVYETVRELLAERGYGGTTFEAVAKESGIPEDQLCYRWSTKAEMVLEIAMMSMRDMEAY